MTKDELHELLEIPNKTFYFNTKSELEFKYLLDILEGVYRSNNWKDFNVNEIIIRVKDNTYLDWGTIRSGWYRENFISFIYLDFSEEETKEENIELNVIINEYIGKLSIPYEALQKLKKGAKLKLL